MTESIYHLMGTESPSANRVDEIFSTMDSNRWPGRGEREGEWRKQKLLVGFFLVLEKKYFRRVQVVAASLTSEGRRRENRVE